MTRRVPVLPRFITFTGIDESTSISALAAIAERYPVEFGVLVSSERQWRDDAQRYPSFQWIADRLLSQDGTIIPADRQPFPIAAHLCGEVARQIVKTGQSYWQRYAGSFTRLQVNVPTPSLGEILRAAAFGADVGRAIIIQTRDTFPDMYTIRAVAASWLYDNSGGRGVLPESWPKNFDGPDLIGFAGGLNPDNVKEAVEHIGAQCLGSVMVYRRQNYWIDMETGVRTDDLFDVRKVRAVCEAVYGADYHRQNAEGS